MKNREKKAKRVSVKPILVWIVAIEILLTFIFFFFNMMDREIPAITDKVDNAVAKVEKLAPTLMDNEDTMLGMYELWLVSRYTYVSDLIKDKRVKTGGDLLSYTADIGISGAFLTDRDGKMIYSCGEKSVMELPYKSTDPIYLYEYKEGEREEEQYALEHDINSFEDRKKTLICYLGESNDQKYYFLGGKVDDGRYLSIQVPRKDEEAAFLNTLNLRKQISNIGKSLGLNALLITYDEKVEATGYNGILRKDNYNEIYIEKYDAYIYRRKDSPFVFFLGKTMEIDNEQYLLVTDIKRVLVVTILNALLLTFIAAFFLAVFARVIYELAEKRSLTRKDFVYNAAVFFCFCLVIVVLFVTFMRSVCDTSGRYLDMEILTGENIDVQDEYTGERDRLEKWLDEQFLIQSRMAAYHCEDNLEKLTRDDLFDLANYMGIEYIYVLDRSGKTVVTNSPDVNFALSKDDNTAEFFPLLSGRNEVVQEPLTDERSGETKQYIGIGLRDKDGICNGCILTTYTATRRKILIDLLEPSTTLNYGLMNSDDKAFIVDRSTGLILESDNGSNIGIDIKQFSIPEAVIKTPKITEYKADGILNIAGSDVFTNGGDSTERMLVMVKESESKLYLVYAALSAALLMLVFLFALALPGIFGFRKKEKEEPEGAEEEEKEQQKDEDVQQDINTIVDSLESEELLKKRYSDQDGRSASQKTSEKYLFEERWKRKRKGINEMSIPEFALYSIRVFAITFTVLSMLPVIMLFAGANHVYGFPTVYILEGNWKSGFNIFSAVAGLLLMAFMVFLSMVIKEVLYQIARVSSNRVETICLLLKSSIKYIFTIVFIIYILSQLGISTTTILASAGVLTMVVGIGAQSITSDLLSGFFLIFERTFDVGDTITVSGKTGVVTEIGLRTTRLIANGDFFVVNNTDVRSVINRSGDFTRINMEIYVSGKTDIREVEELMAKKLPDMKNSVEGLVRAPKYAGISNITATEMRLKFSLYTISYKRSDARMGFIRQMKLLFEENGIEMLGSSGSSASDDLGF